MSASHEADEDGFVDLDQVDLVCDGEATSPRGTLNPSGSSGGVEVETSATAVDTPPATKPPHVAPEQAAVPSHVEPAANNAYRDFTMDEDLPSYEAGGVEESKAAEKVPTAVSVNPLVVSPSPSRPHIGDVALKSYRAPAIDTRTDAIEDPGQSPPVSLLSASDLARRFNACLKEAQGEGCGSGQAMLAAAECDLLKNVAFQLLNLYGRNTAPTDVETAAVVALAAMLDVQTVRHVVNTLARRVTQPTSVSPEAVMAVAHALRFATNACRESAKYSPRPHIAVKRLGRHMLNAATEMVVGAASDHAGVELHARVGSATASAGAAAADATAGTGMVDVEGAVAGAGEAVVDAMVGLVSDGAVDALDMSGRDDEAPQTSTPTDARRRDVVTIIFQCVQPAFEKVVGNLQHLSMRSRSRTALLTALCQLTDALVDAVHGDGDGSSPDGVRSQWHKDLEASLRLLDKVITEDNDYDGFHQLLYAREAVRHVGKDAASEAEDLLKTTTELFAGGARLVSAVASKNPADVASVLSGMVATYTEYRASQPSPWYDAVRVLTDLQPARMLDMLKEVKGAKNTRHPPHATFFVVDMLDKLARQPPLALSASSGAELTRVLASLDPDHKVTGATDCTHLREQVEQVHHGVRSGAIKALADVFTERCPSWNADTKEEMLRASIIQRLYQLCRLPNAALSDEAKQALRVVVQYEEPGPLWRRILLPCTSSRVNVAEYVSDITGVPSVATVDTIPTDPLFYDQFSSAAARLWAGRTVPTSDTVPLVAAAFKAFDRVEAAVEQLRDVCERQAVHANTAQEAAMYVPPLASVSSKDGDDKAVDLDDTVTRWLSMPVADARVLLLHGHSGAGKSLYCALLEARLWNQYRRGLSDAVTPLRISLSACSAPEKSAVAETLDERCGLLLSAAAQSNRTWVVVLDGFDEVQGKTNFVAGNKLAMLLPNAKVIVTCRTEYLEGLTGGYAALFRPGAVGTASQLTERFVRAFKGDQLDAFFHKFVAHRDGATDGAGRGGVGGSYSTSRWSAAEYTAFIKHRKLEHLAASPFVLRVMGDALPRLGESVPITGSGSDDPLDDYDSQPITQAHVFGAFLDAWWEKEYERLRANWPPGLPHDFDAAASYTSFGQDLAMEMLSRNQLSAESTSSVYIMGGLRRSVWTRFFYSTPVVSAARQGVPLRRSGRNYSFVHKSIAEYMAACAMWADVVAVSAGQPLGSAASLGRLHTADQPAVLAFLVDKYWSLPPSADAGRLCRTTAVQALHTIVQRSASDESVTATGDGVGWATAAANAAGVLAQAGVPLFGAMWQGTVLRRAMLNDAVLVTADLRGADLTGASLRRIVADGADLRGAVLTDVDLGVHPTLEGHTAKVTSVAFSPDGLFIVSGSRDQTVRMWNAQTVSLCWTATLPGSKDVVGVTSVAFSPDGRSVASGGDDDRVHVWNSRTGSPTATLAGHKATVTCVAFSPDGSSIASGSQDGTVRLWDVRSGSCGPTLDSGAAVVTSVAFSPDGSSIVSGNSDGSAHVWDAAAGHWHKSLTLTGHSAAVSSVAFSPDGVSIVTGSQDQLARVWNAKTGSSTAVLEGHEGWVSTAAFSPDGSLIVTGSGDGTLRLSDARTGAFRASLKGHRGGVLSAAFSPDGSSIVSGSNDHYVRVWDAHVSHGTATIGGHSRKVTSVAVSPDGSLVVSGSLDKTLRVWNMRTGACRGKLEGYTKYIRAVAFSPDGSVIASGGMDNLVRLWTLSSGTCTAALAGHKEEVMGVVFSPDGLSVASCSGDGTARLWDVATGENTATFVGHTDWVNTVAFFPGGSAIVTGSADNTVRVWNVGTGAAVAELEGHTGEVTSVAVSPDGVSVVSGSSDRTVKVWAVKEAVCTATLEGHDGRVNSVAVSPDGASIASGSQDKTVRVWADGRVIATLDGHAEYVTSVTFSSDGSSIVTGSQDRTVRVWTPTAAATPDSPGTPTSPGPMTLPPGAGSPRVTDADTPVRSSTDWQPRLMLGKLGRLSMVAARVSGSLASPAIHTVLGQAGATGVPSSVPAVLVVSPLMYTSTSSMDSPIGLGHRPLRARSSTRLEADLAVLKEQSHQLKEHNVRMKNQMQDHLQLQIRRMKDTMREQVQKQMREQHAEVKGEISKISAMLEAVLAKQAGGT